MCLEWAAFLLDSRGGALAPPIPFPTKPNDPQIMVFRFLCIAKRLSHAGTDCAIQSPGQWPALMCDGIGAFYFVLCETLVARLMSFGSLLEFRDVRGCL